MDTTRHSSCDSSWFSTEFSLITVASGEVYELCDETQFCVISPASSLGPSTINISGRLAGHLVSVVVLFVSLPHLHPIVSSDAVSSYRRCRCWPLRFFGRSTSVISPFSMVHRCKSSLFTNDNHDLFLSWPTWPVIKMLLQEPVYIWSTSFRLAPSVFIQIRAS